MPEIGNVGVLQLLLAGRSSLINQPSIVTEGTALCLDSPHENITKISWFADTPLHVACIDRSEEAAEFLISSGADLNAQNLRGEVPM